MGWRVWRKPVGGMPSMRGGVGYEDGSSCWVVLRLGCQCVACGEGGDTGVGYAPASRDCWCIVLVSLVEWADLLRACANAVMVACAI